MTDVLARLGAWRDLPFFRDDWPILASRLATDAREILPPATLIFAALERVPPQAVRVVILGQDPYPTPGHATGLAFSVTPGVALPRSLANIYAEMADDLGQQPASGDLGHWADQGVLLLNTVLTVPAGMSGGHAKLGWQILARQVLAHVSARPTAFWLWGRGAQGFADDIPASDHLVIATPHPSPLSARRGFFGSRPFSRTNDWLRARGGTPIDWVGPLPIPAAEG